MQITAADPLAEVWPVDDRKGFWPIPGVKVGAGANAGAAPGPGGERQAQIKSKEVSLARAGSVVAVNVALEDPQRRGQSTTYVVRHRSETVGRRVSLGVDIIPGAQEIERYGVGWATLHSCMAVFAI